MIKKLKEFEELNVFLFPFITLYVAPLIHEYIHVIVLDFYKCPYNMIMTFKPTGIYGHIEPLCLLTTFQTVVVLIAPILILLSLGMLLFGLSFEHRIKGYPFTPIFLSSIAIGFITSTGLDFFSSHSDVKTAMSSMGIEIGNSTYYFTGTFILITGILLYLDILFEINKEVQIRIPRAKRI